MRDGDQERTIGVSEQERDKHQSGEGFMNVASSILENDVVGIAVLDAEGVYRVFNRGAEMLTGYSREDVLGYAPPDNLFSPDDQRLIGEALKSQGRVENMELIIRRKDGDEKHVIMSMSSRTVGGEDKRVCVQFLLDNTEKKHMQKLLLHSQKMEIVGEMAGGIAHDFNNLLEGILGYTTFMMDLIEEHHELRSYLEIIERSAKKASDLTERLLTFSKDAGKRASPVDCNVLLQEVVKLLERMIDRRIVIEMDLDKNVKTVRGAAGKLEQAFLNVCLNARDAMPSGGKLQISSENIVINDTYPRLSWNMKRGEYVRISVSDTGSGMDSEIRSKMFEPFFTTKNRGEGTGLGLNIVYGIVHNHEGFINVYSEAGRGTVFNMYLPAHEAKVGEEMAREAKGEIPGGDNEMILFIDDEPIVRELGRNLLEKLGYRAITAGSAEDGLHIFKKRGDDIDLVVIDVIMPGASGQEAMKKMRERKPGVLVVLSSGYSKNFLSEEITEDARVSFIQKPYSMEELAREIRKCLDLHKKIG